MGAMPRPRPPHLLREITRHERAVWYVRVGKGPRIRIRAEYGTEDFWSQYRAALDGAPLGGGTLGLRRLLVLLVVVDQLAWALERYRQSSSWAALSNATRRQRENI